MATSEGLNSLLLRLSRGAVDTIESARMMHGRPSLTEGDPDKIMSINYVAYGTIAHLANLAEQAGVTAEFAKVLIAIERNLE